MITILYLKHRYREEIFSNLEAEVGFPLHQSQNLPNLD